MTINNIIIDRNQYLKMQIMNINKIIFKKINIKYIYKMNAN